MAVKNVGKGLQYAIAYLDKDGKALDGSKTHKINLPPNIPAKDFWYFTIYDNQTRSMFQTVPGKGWNTILHLYGPLEPFYDKSWKPGDPEVVAE